MELQPNDLADFFADPQVLEDRTGSLASVAQSLRSCEPSLVFIADCLGRLVAVDHLGSDVAPAVVGPIATELAGRLTADETCQLSRPATLGDRAALGVRLHVRTNGAFLGIILPTSALARIPNGDLRERLAVAGSLAWDVLQVRATEVRLRTQLRHLRAEQETWKVSYAKALVDAIEERERRLRVQAKYTAQIEAVMKTTPDAIVLVDAEDRIVSFNEAGTRIFGYASDEVVGRDVHEALTAPQYRERCRPIFERFRERGEGAILGGVVEFAGIRKTGEEFPIELSLSSTTLDDRWHAVVVIRDITERKRRETELAAYRTRLEELVKDRTAEIVQANTQLQEEIAERKRAETVLRVQRDLSLILSATSDLGEAVQACADAAIQASGMDGAGVFVADAEGSFRLAAHCGLPPELVHSASCYGKDSVQAGLVMQGRPIYTRHGDLPLPHTSPFLSEHCRVLAILPICHRGRVIGCLGVMSQTLEETPPATRNALELIAAQIGNAMARIQAAEDLKRNETKYRLLAENLKDLVFTVSLDGTLTYCSPVIREFAGYDPEEEIGCNIRKYIVKEEDLTLAAGQVQRVIAEKTAVTMEFLYRPKVGDPFPVEVTAKPLIEGDTVVALQCVMRDITLRKQVEEELRRAKIAAEAANRAKSEFLANMSHEIRTPMTAILGFTDIVLGNLSEPENVDAANAVKRNGEYLLEIIDDILDLSKIEAERFEVEMIPCSPRQIVADAAALMRVRADAKGLPLAVEFDGPLPETITTDPTRLRQILINLVGNAIKFTETGGVRVVTRLVRQAGQPSMLQCDVVDTGIGMTHEEIGRLFHPFTQGDAATSRKFGGTGLGLAISQRLAKMLGGTIAVQSVRGEGSCFRLSIATGALDDVPLREGPGETAAGIAAPASDRPIADPWLDCRILLVEDGPDNQRLISFLLKKAGAEVVIAQNGKEAVDLVLGDAARQPCPGEDVPNPFDVILMDIQMPVMDGYEATRRLRAQGYTGPIVALTAHAMSHDIRRCLDAGCDMHMSKPVDREKLLATIASLTPTRS